jgi:hypothetical protein
MPSVASATRSVDPNGVTTPREKTSAVDSNQTRMCRLRSFSPPELSSPIKCRPQPPTPVDSLCVPL